MKTITLLAIVALLPACAFTIPDPSPPAQDAATKLAPTCEQIDGPAQQGRCE